MLSAESFHYKLPFDRRRGRIFTQWATIIHKSKEIIYFPRHGRKLTDINNLNQVCKFGFIASNTEVVLNLVPKV